MDDAQTECIITLACRHPPTHRAALVVHNQKSNHVNVMNSIITKTCYYSVNTSQKFILLSLISVSSSRTLVPSLPRGSHHNDHSDLVLMKHKLKRFKRNKHGDSNTQFFMNIKYYSYVNLSTCKQASLTIQSSSKELFFYMRVNFGC